MIWIVIIQCTAILMTRLLRKIKNRHLMCQMKKCFLLQTPLKFWKWSKHKLSLMGEGSVYRNYISVTFSPEQQNKKRMGVKSPVGHGTCMLEIHVHIWYCKASQHQEWPPWTCENSLWASADGCIPLPNKQSKMNLSQNQSESQKQWGFC